MLSMSQEQKNDQHCNTGHFHVESNDFCWGFRIDSPVAFPSKNAMGFGATAQASDDNPMREYRPAEVDPNSCWLLLLLMIADDSPNISSKRSNANSWFSSLTFCNFLKASAPSHRTRSKWDAPGEQHNGWWLRIQHVNLFRQSFTFGYRMFHPTLYGWWLAWYPQYRVSLIVLTLGAGSSTDAYVPPASGVTWHIKGRVAHAIFTLSKWHILTLLLRMWPNLSIPGRLSGSI